MSLLISKAKKHDKIAFQQLIEQHEKAMYQMAKSILKNDDDVADAMQETILACWEKIDTLKEAGSLPEIMKKKCLSIIIWKAK